jgi:DNA-binding response OmpR family regulator
VNRRDQRVNQKTILIVEDNPARSLAVRRFLEKEGIRVFWARNGRRGISIARDRRPDMIVLDVEMPDLDGLEVCERLRMDSRTAGIPIVMLTVLSRADVLFRGSDLGVACFIPKDPCSNLVLVEALRQLKVLDDFGGARGCCP